MFNLLNQLKMMNLKVTKKQLDMLDYFIDVFKVCNELPSGWRCRTFRGNEFSDVELKELELAVQSCYWGLK